MHQVSNHDVPSRDQCHRLLETYGVPDHIVRHSEMVSKVARFLSERLNNKGEHLDLNVIEAAGLLHDITKIEGIKTQQDHAETGRKLLEGLGFRRIGEIVGEHIRLQPHRETIGIREEEIINYSDKRVMHTKVVTLEERFEDLEHRYGLKGLDKDVTERIKAAEQKAYELESKIFSTLDFPPEKLLEQMDMASS
jgi:uncharacterized protein